MTTVDDVAAPLDALLIDAAFGPLWRLAPDLSTARFARRLAAQPGATISEPGSAPRTPSKRRPRATC